MLDSALIPVLYCVIITNNNNNNVNTGKDITQYYIRSFSTIPYDVFNSIFIKLFNTAHLRDLNYISKNAGRYGKFDIFLANQLFEQSISLNQFETKSLKKKQNKLRQINPEELWQRLQDASRDLPAKLQYC